MKASAWRRQLLMLAVCFVPARDASPDDVEFAPFVGFQYGGSFASASSGRDYSIGSGLQYGATLDIPVVPSWRVELLYSRQESDLSAGSGIAGFGMSVEHYMVGVQEEKAEDWGRFFGVFLLGLTRFSPGFGGYDSDERFTLGLSLGVKTSLSDRIGVRGEARGFFVNVESGGGIACINGACLFRFSASGLWQGDVTAALVIGF